MKPHESHVMDYLGDLGVKVLHVLAEHLAKLAEDFFVPRVVLQVHLRLDLFGGLNMNFKCLSTNLF